MDPLPPAFGWTNGYAVRMWTTIDGRHRPTGASRHTVGGSLMRAARGLVTVEMPPTEGYYLLYCDGDWNEWTDTFHETLEGPLAQAEFEYEGVGGTWVRAAPV